MIFLDHLVGFDLSHKVATLLSKDYGVFVVGKRLDGVDFLHDLVVQSLLGKTLLKLLFSLTLKFDCLSNLRCNLLLSIGNGRHIISISIGHDFGSLCLSFLDNLSLDKLGLGSDLVVFKISFCIDFLNLSCRLGLPFLLNFLGLSLNLLNFLVLVKLVKLCLLLNVFSLLLFDLFLFDLLFLIILNSLFVSEGLALERVFELVDGTLLH